MGEEKDKRETSGNTNATEKSKSGALFRIETFLAGGVAGCAAKTLVAPIDRVKILLQVHNTHYEGVGVLQSFGRVVQKESFFALYKGNGAQLIRIFPYAALQFSSYEVYKTLNKRIFGKRAENLINGLVCGSLAGMTAVTFTYPLDVIRSRLAFQVKGKEIYAGILDAVRKIYQEEKRITSFYRGYGVTILGMIPYAGLSFASYDRIKSFILRNKIDTLAQSHKSVDDPSASNYYELTVAGKLVCGAFTGALTQTLTYPVDVVRRHMQLSIMIKDSGYKETMGIIDTAKYVYQKHGIVRGFYRGITLNYLRAVPMVATSFCIYEIGKKYLGLDTGLKMH